MSLDRLILCYNTVLFVVVAVVLNKIKKSSYILGFYFMNCIPEGKLEIVQELPNSGEI